MITAEQLRMARAALGWSTSKLCDKTGLHRNTISNVENGGELRASTEAILQNEFQNNGIEFINATGNGVGVILSK